MQRSRTSQCHAYVPGFSLQASTRPYHTILSSALFLLSSAPESGRNPAGIWPESGRNPVGIRPSRNPAGIRPESCRKPAGKRFKTKKVQNTMIPQWDIIYHFGLTPSSSPLEQSPNMWDRFLSCVAGSTRDCSMVFDELFRFRKSSLPGICLGPVWPFCGSRVFP